MGDLEINPMKNKFDFLEDVINRHLNIILLSETKLDDSFLQPNLSQRDLMFNIGFTGTAKMGGLVMIC